MALSAPVPAEISVPVFEVVLRMRLHGQICINVHHYRRSVGPGAASDQANLEFVFRGSIIPAYRALTSNELLYDFITVRTISVRTTPPFDGPFIAQTGTVVERSNPSVVAALLTKYSVFGGRSGRGRTFVAGIPESYEEESLLTAPAIVLANTLAGLLDSALTFDATLQFIPVVVSRRSPTNPGEYRRASDVRDIIVRKAVVRQGRRGRYRPDPAAN